MRKARRWRGYTVMLALAALTATACGTRLPNNAFVNANGEGANGTAAGTRSGATAKATTATSSASSGATGAGAGATPAAGAGPGGEGGTAAPGGSGAADGPNQASDTGVTENEIVIGNITAIDGILGDAFAPPLRGLQAFVQYTNDHGGVHGRKIRLEICN